MKFAPISKPSAVKELQIISANVQTPYNVDRFSIRDNNMIMLWTTRIGSL